MADESSILPFKIENIEKNFLKLEGSMQSVTKKITEQDKDIAFIKNRLYELDDKKASLHHVNNKTSGILLLNKHIDDLEVSDKIQNDKIAENAFNIEKLSYKIDNTVSSVDKLVVKLDNMTTPKTIGIIMGAVVAFCGFILGVVKLLNMV